MYVDCFGKTVPTQKGYVINEEMFQFLVENYKKGFVVALSEDEARPHQKNLDTSGGYVVAMSMDV